MKRSQVIALFDRLHNLVRDYYRTCKLLSAVYHAVSDCPNLVKTFYNSGFSVRQSVDHELDCFCVGRHSLIRLHLLPALRLVSKTSVDSDSLAESLCKNFFRIRVDQLEF